MSTRLLTRFATPTLALVLAAGALTAAPATGAPADLQVTGAQTTGATTTDQRAALPSGWKPRPEQYPSTVTETDLAITMSDGVVLRGDLVRPADGAGNPIPGRFPVVVTITAYKKTALSSAGGLGGPGPAYLVKRGYAQLTVDARGTGSSGGTWGAFSARESKDAGEIVEWAHRQRAWSNGAIAMTGPSYMGISQILAASHQPAGLKAIFPQVPAADVYRDVVASGGQLDVGFIPLWLGLVTATGLIPPAYAASDPTSGVGTLLDHVAAFGTFTLPLLLGATLGGDAAYDGPFYAERSPINVVDKVTVPTFFVGGHYDLFQRGTPLLFENLRKRGVPTKMILGPWDHLQGSGGDGVAAAGYGTLEELQLRWFDHHVRGIADPGLDSDIAPLTYHEIGTGDWRQARDWIGPNLRATSFRLSGSSTPALAVGGLTTGTAAPGTSSVPPVPVSGLCTRSASQWTAGAPATIAADLP
ncbi:CocE/NonD family hydrolase, partial [Nocardioides sp.]|uniref:CocE/NonD family hydrolase n=1 Tax=Nocardioides sp. TaxID=35761 RepID=UPI0027352F7C